MGKRLVISKQKTKCDCCGIETTLYHIYYSEDNQLKDHNIACNKEHLIQLVKIIMEKVDE
jgi:hypothetical protein